ncbi:hypothetical protein B0T16DRAFT_415513 [Cercophora newfieldiana]|uniref:Uncharacterized protein n=1 Tax=Cercophora newfieldiana TaxID=92897 RepID=A0AA39Y166_9PEZI|nr:hypothetical protein B0T16DRAFT_415513 [Cercophora newfieldiana]
MHTHPSPSPSTPVAGARRRYRGRVRQGSESKLQALACPFYRFNPRNYHDCRGFTLRRVKDVKQHIARKHTHTALPNSEEPRQNHDTATHNTHQQDLSPHHAWSLRHGADNPLLVITGEQKKKLKSYLGRGKPIQEQWYEIWNILFPGRDRPQSIYLHSTNNSRGEHLRMLRRVWETHRDEIFSKTSPFPINIPGALPPPGVGDIYLPGSGSHRSSWQQSGAISAVPITCEIVAQRHLFDQVMDAFLNLVGEEMTDDDAEMQVDDTDGPNHDSRGAEVACSFLGVQRPWPPSVSSVNCAGNFDFILWQQFADQAIEIPGIDMATQGGLELASGNLAYSFPLGLSGSPW